MAPNRKNKSKPRPKRPLKSQELSRKPVDLLVTVDLEIAIASCKKKVESIIKTCKAKNVRFRDRDFDLQFEPWRCLHGYTKGETVNVPQKDVQRVTDLYDNPCFFPEGGAATSNAISQGCLGDCYFLAALATVSSIPSLINKICVARDEQVGVYGFIFYGDDGWRSVIIDDLLYTKVAKFEELDEKSKALYHNNKESYNAVARKGGKTLLFAGAGSQDEVWVPLIEKAYAKYYGNYAHLSGGFSSEAVEDLTGGVSSVFLAKDILDTDQFWKEELLNVNKDRVFGCGFDSLRAINKDDEDGEDGELAPSVEGLIGSHAYSILRAVEYKGKRFVVLRNPWGTGEWTGRWSDGSQEWNGEWLEALKVLKHRFGNDGQFVMEYSDFLQHFQDIERTFLFDATWRIEQLWMEVPIFPGLRAQAYGVVSFVVTMESATKAIFSLSRLNNRSFQSIGQPAIRLEFALVRAGDREPIAKACERRPFASRSITLEQEVDAGTYFIYVSFDREDGDHKFDNNNINMSTRVKSTILSNKVRARSVVKYWEPIGKKFFMPMNLEDVIEEDLLFLAPNQGYAYEEDGELEDEGDDSNAEVVGVELDSAQEAGDAGMSPKEADDAKEVDDNGEKSKEADSGKATDEVEQNLKKDEGAMEGQETKGSTSDSSDGEDLSYLFNDGQSVLFVGMRVYTQSKEPPRIVGRWTYD